MQCLVYRGYDEVFTYQFTQYNDRLYVLVIEY